jgi:hypothetical protein
MYRWRMSESCPGLNAQAAAKDEVSKCDDSDPGVINSIFFATQTITTTGYGTGVSAGVPDVQLISIPGMIVGSLLWAIFTGAIIAEIFSSQRLRLFIRKLRTSATVASSQATSERTNAERVRRLARELESKMKQQLDNAEVRSSKTAQALAEAKRVLEQTQQQLSETTSLLTAANARIASKPEGGR